LTDELAPSPTRPNGFFFLFLEIDGEAGHGVQCGVRKSLRRLGKRLVKYLRATCSKKKTLRATAMEIDSEFHQYPGAWY